MNNLEADIAAFIEDETAGDFEALALRLFAYQYEHIKVMGALAKQAGRTPDTVTRWQDIPPVPTTAFKQTLMFAGKEPTRVFESSGTSGDARSRAAFSATGLELMDVAIRANAERCFLNDGRATRILVLAPAPELAPQMIMAWGMQRLVECYGLPGSGFFIGSKGLDARGLIRALQSTETPVTVIGATFGFVHLLDEFAHSGTRFYCAEGSRTMDAGGFKGRSRVVSRSEMEGLMTDRLEIPAQRQVNLLGMTELASQFYDGVLAQGSASPRRKLSPHWTRTRVLDPRTLTPASRGILVHLDLANVERPFAIRSDDIGECDAQGWNILGRASHADPKGCSLTVEEYLQKKATPHLKLAKT